MQQHRPILIVGAGPTGLAAALFLTQLGVSVRIVDQALAPDLNSRALVVNPRSLELLKKSDITDLDFKDIEMPHPILALTQASTEAALARPLAALGVRVERGVTLVNFDNADIRLSARAA
jgi:2-polyprenyl-6-methoxyphenol hydroxylase-like FAD-dependent oxidoreductase